MMNTDNIVETTLRNGGGTFDPKTGHSVLPPGGYAVGLVEGTLVRVLAENPDVFALVLSAVAKRFPAAWVGTWVKDGEVHIDPVMWVLDRDEAIYQARRTNQKAIWDFKNGVEIEIV